MPSERSPRTGSTSASHARRAAILLPAIGLSLIGTAGAATYDATNATNFWDLTTQNWNSSTATWTNGDDATFGGTGEDVNVEAAIQVHNITFNSTGYTIRDDATGGTSNNGTLTLTGTTPTITVTNSADIATISENIAGAGGLTKSGPGQLTLSGTNTFSGGVVIKEGIVRQTSSSALTASGSVTIGDSSANKDATLSLATNSGNSFVIASGSGLRKIDVNPSASSPSPYAGTITLGNNLTLDMSRSADRVGNFSGQITGSSKITTSSNNNSSKPGISLTGNNASSFTGNIEVTGGFLGFDAGSLGTTGTITLNKTSTTTSNDPGLVWNTGNTEDVSARLQPIATGVNAVLDVGANDVSFGTANGLSGGGTIRKKGTGTLALSASNNVSGIVTFFSSTADNGTLAFGNNNALGTSVLTISGTAGFRSTNTTTRTIANALGTFAGTNAVYTFGSTTPSLNGDLVFSSTALASLGAGANRTFQVHNTTSIASALSNTSNINKTGNGTLILNGNSAYSGGTTVTAGTVLADGGSVGAAGNSATGIGSVTVTSAGTLGGTGWIVLPGTSALSVAGKVDLATNATATDLDIGLTGTGNADFVSGAELKFELGAPGTSDVIDFTGLTDASIVNFNNNVVNFSNLGGLAQGTYTLFTFDAGTLADNYAGNLQVGTGLGSFTGTFIYNASNIQLSVAIPEPASLSLLGLIGASVLKRRRRSA